MSRVFAYARVSTVDQVTENQREQIATAGYNVEQHRFIEEKVSGSVPAMQRPGFKRLLDKLEPGDTLVVTKLDRIGRDNIDVQQTVEAFAASGVRLVVLQLGNLDLTSSSGAFIVKLLSAVAAFERELIVERTKAGQARARAQGKHLGRPRCTTESQRREMVERVRQGDSVAAVARAYGVSRATVSLAARAIASSPLWPATDASGLASPGLLTPGTMSAAQRLLP